MTSGYPKVVKDAIIKSSYAEMAHIYAISATLGMSIHSYYPPQLNPILSGAFTRNIYGQKVATGSTCKLSIKWTLAIVPKTPKEFRVNHFVS